LSHSQEYADAGEDSVPAFAYLIELRTSFSDISLHPQRKGNPAMKKMLLKVLIGTFIAAVSIAITSFLFQTNFVQRTFGFRFFHGTGPQSISMPFMRMRGGPSAYVECGHVKIG